MPNKHRYEIEAELGGGGIDTYVMNSCSDQAGDFSSGFPLGAALVAGTAT